MSEERLNEPLSSLESALTSLRWRPSNLDRARVMYLAGQASVKGAKGTLCRRPGAWLWPMMTAVSLLLAAVLGGILLVSPRQQAVERPIHVPIEHPRDAVAAPDSIRAVVAASQEPPLRTDYLALRRLVLTQGVDAWPMAPDTGSPDGHTLTPADAYRGSIDPDRKG